MIVHNHGIVVRAVATMTAAFIAFGAMQAGAAVDACTQTTPPTGGTPYTSDGMGNEAGDGNHTLWHDGSGSMTMTVYGKDAAFKASWSSAGDFLARTGFQWNEVSPYTAYGNVTADYNYKATGVTGTGYSYIGIYGWSNNPLVEYYINENGFNGIPGTGALGSGTVLKGSFTVDGSVYNIYTHPQVNKASIHGTTNFTQYWSVRQTPRTCGHISLSEHWKKWDSLGMPLGKMYEAKLLVEAGSGSGTVDFTYGVMQINAPTTSVLPQETVPQISRSGATSWVNGKTGVLSLVSLNGSVVRSIHQDASSLATVPTSNLAKGLYLLRFQGEGSAPETRKFLLD
jgi:hypothetical protein